ncbi:MAG: peptidylprolyl isomerase [Bacteriovoracaceae bacterium]|nr:peptidylprolyl isomerase [Bacteriovoracaceae bacterium]
MATKCDYKEPIDRATAVFETSMGEFEIELFVKECPESCWNLINLAEGRQETKKSGLYYDGLIFHRVIEGFMIQGGCPEGLGNGGPGYSFKDEFDSNLRHDSVGILSMANAGPNTNGSQFFITLGPTPHLDGRHSVFGKVVKGLEIVQKIGSTPTGSQDRPVSDVTINKVTIKR